MSGIEELIAELCPDGVEFRPLRDVGTWYGGGTPSKSNAEFWRDGTVPWLSPKDMVVETIHATGLRVSVKALEQSPLKLVPAGSVAFVVRSNVLRRRFPIALVPFDVTLNQDMRAVVPHEDVLPEYLLQACRSRAESILAVAGRTDGSMAAIKSATLLDFRIPIPPIEIQREVVGVLNRFSSLQAELELQLQAELELRRQQYRHYRDAILSFSERERERESQVGAVERSGSVHSRQAIHEGRL